MKARPKIGKQTRLDEVQARYRDDMMRVYDLPWEAQADRVRFLLKRLRDEKAAIGAKDDGADE